MTFERVRVTGIVRREVTVAGWGVLASVLGSTFQIRHCPSQETRPELFGRTVSSMNQRVWIRVPQTYLISMMVSAVSKWPQRRDRLIGTEWDYQIIQMPRLT